jgi:DNA-binding NtrC family response regulator
MIKASRLEAISKIILVVEDNALIRMLLVEVLLEAKFAVMEAENAESALRMLDAQGIGINLLLTDVHMPGAMNGLVLTHHVYSNWPSIRLIIVSGRARPLVEEMPPGCQFLPKPYNLDHVILNIRQMTSSL